MKEDAIKMLPHMAGRLSHWSLFGSKELVSAFVHPGCTIATLKLLDERCGMQYNKCFS
jgi:hypothetical protein